jgi:hypothetical protein
MKLYDIAYSRAGDKGDISNVCVFVEDDAHWPLILEKLTADKVREKFGALVKGDVTRYVYPNLHGLNFVLEGALDGGCNFGLRLDVYGKSYSSLILDIDL